MENVPFYVRMNMILVDGVDIKNELNNITEGLVNKIVMNMH